MKVCLKLTPFQSVVAKEVYAKVDLIWCIMLWTILIVKYTDSFEFVYNFKEIRDKNKNKAFKICSVGIPSDSRLRESFGWGSISCYFLLFFHHYIESILQFFYRTLLKPVPKDKSTNIWMCSDYIYVSGSNCVVARY